MLALVNTDAVVMLLAVCWDGEGTVVIGRRNWKSRYSGYCGGQPNLCAEIRDGRGPIFYTQPHQPTNL